MLFVTDMDPNLSRTVANATPAERNLPHGTILYQTPGNVGGDDGGRWYVWVENDSGATLARGVAVMRETADDQLEVALVTANVNAAFVVGVVQRTGGIANVSVGFVQYKGPGAVVQGDGTLGATEVLIPGGVAGQVGGSTSATAANFGWAFSGDGGVATTISNVVLNCNGGI